MKLLSLASHAASLYKIIKNSSSPSDKLASDYLAAKKYIGSKERKFVSEVAFLSFRIKRVLERLSSTPNARKVFSNGRDDVSREFFEVVLALYLVAQKAIDCGIDGKYLYENLPQKEKSDLTEETLSAAATFFGETPKTIEASLDKATREYLASREKVESISSLSLASESDLEEFADFFSLSKIAVKKLSKKFSKEEIENIALSFFKSAPLGLRVNSMAASREKVLEYLLAKGMPAEAGNLSPDSIIVRKRINLAALDIYKAGIVEIQDEGSQLVSCVLDPAKGSKILDACAGAGGKSLHLAALTEDSAEIIATDVSAKKLKEAIKRAKRSGFRSIIARPVGHKTSPEKIFRAEYFDYVLIDAPCSGFGVSRRSPQNKYKISESLISRLAANQLKILELYSRFLKNGGILVYSTCSLIPDENEEVVEKFLERNGNFEKISPADSLKKRGVPTSVIDKNDNVFLSPHSNDTDGFFIAKFRKKRR